MVIRCSIAQIFCLKTSTFIIIGWNKALLSIRRVMTICLMNDQVLQLQRVTVALFITTHVKCINPIFFIQLSVRLWLGWHLDWWPAFVWNTICMSFSGAWQNVMSFSQTSSIWLATVMNYVLWQKTDREWQEFVSCDRYIAGLFNLRPAGQIRRPAATVKCHWRVPRTN